MKNVILAAMAVMTLAGSANAASDWDIFWGTTVAEALDPTKNGWNDFWFQCHTGDAGACMGVIATGTAAVIAGPIVLPIVAATTNAITVSN